MRKLTLIVTLLAAVLTLRCAVGFAGELYTHTVKGQADPGVTTSLPNGETSTTFADGWTRTSEPDNSFGAGGTKVTEKDGRGRVHNIVQYDPKHTVRHQTVSLDQADGTIKLTNMSYAANGERIDYKTEIVTPAATEPSSPQTSPQGTSGSPPSPGSDQTSGAPPSGSGAPIFGGFGFGFGVGGDQTHGPDPR